MQDITVGLNWLLNPNTKLQFNYVAAWVNNTTPVAGPNNSLNGSAFCRRRRDQQRRHAVGLGLLIETTGADWWNIDRRSAVDSRL